ncbi:partitioning defective 3 homolog isoform X7 [Cherax quadricarinatus]|uniref:partitioning defective 3 homolog isoform X7 n=1 Tax=Cherax quadricarinatus TaxID=27406 RepID=UPI002378AC18|nr:partitioning defective 3 homolog isoform X7 [Cherax quadricarinatus]
MRMRSRSVAGPPIRSSTTSSTSITSSTSNTTSSTATSSITSRSVSNLPGELKLHYSDVVNVAEKLARLFSRTHTYNVYKRHKTLSSNCQPSDSWVTVHNLKQLDGGILDPDDRLNDVADDREQIIALYEEQAHHHHGGDGTSASSDSENPSPDIFQVPVLFQDIEHKFSPFTRNDIEITGEELSATPPPLHVRRGSEPALNRLSPIPPASAPPDPTKRWSAAPIIEDQNTLPSSTPMKSVDGHSSYEDDNVFVVDPGERGEGSGEEKTPSSSSSSSHHSTTTAFTRFSRDTNRCSVQVLSDNPAMARWADAADKALAVSEGRRREPLGGSASSPLHSRNPSHDDSNNIMLVVLSNDRGPLGIHVIPSTDGRGHDQGLLVEGVESGGRIARDGRIEVHDRIIEINGKPLNNITFQKAQEIFKDAMLTPELRLQVIKRPDLRDTNHHHQGSLTLSSDELVEGEERLVGGAKVASVMPTRKVPPASLSSRTQAVILQSNTRKLGRKVTVHLTKGPHGLGFSITTRDNPAGGEAPIYIKNILPKGAAIEDGTLRIGDRLLEVNGVEVTGRSQSDVAGLLRQIPIGGAATLTVSRQDQRNGDPGSGIVEVSETDKPSSPKLPRQLVSIYPQDSHPFFCQPAEKTSEDSLMFPWKQREILMFEIPVHDSERAGLGVSVKGKTSSGPNGSVDLGIFVKNVIHGGAASRDGRLLQNDQLVNINGLSLLGKPNSEAMKTLRTAMHQEGPTPGMISLTVARRTDHKERSSPSSANRSGRESANSLLTNSSGTETLGGAKSSPATPTPDHSGIIDSSETTVTLNSKYDDWHDTEGGEFTNMGTFDIRNPVIQRLTTNNGALRNESYYKATHDTWNTSQLQHFVMRNERETLTTGVPGMNPLGSPTVNLPSRDTLIIHDDVGTHLSSQLGGSDGPGASTGSYSDHPSQSDDAYTSQTSLEENVAGFSRDQFGRQSMSEKRHATLDAKNTDTYQRNKKAREERERQKQLMLAQDKLSTSQGLGVMAAEGGAPEEVKPGSREVGIDVSSTDPPPVVPQHTHPPKKKKIKSDSEFKSIATNSGQSSSAISGASSSLVVQQKSKSNKFFSSEGGTKPQLKQQLLQNTRVSLRRGSEPLNSNLGRGTPKVQWCGYPRGPFSAVTHSLERHYNKGNQRTTFGQDLSNMISNWAARNRELLSREPVMGKLVRASSDESLASQTLQRTNHAHHPSSHEHISSQDALRSRLDFGPGLGMKKSSSLESLQTMVQEMALEEEGHRMGSGRVPRGRGCNESFRAAVDRSYDVPLNGLRSKMETLAEEESESSGSGFGRGNSRQSSVNSAAEDKHKKVGKKKPGLFKGLGSMFRFGKHRKSVDNTSGLPMKGEREGERIEGRNEMDRAEVERLAAARRLQQEEHDHMQEQYRRMIENTARASQSQQQQQQPQIRGDDGEPSRSERMHQLRAEHQRRHAQRNRTYPTDDLEERYESALRQHRRKALPFSNPFKHHRSYSQDLIGENHSLGHTMERLDPVPNDPKPDTRHTRSHSYDLYGDNIGRPGSRTAYADPHKYSHYVNYEQIQQHLRKNKEQERLKKLASQQYQDFRDKQTRRQQDTSNGTLLHKLEETFIHESILARYIACGGGCMSREAREYQSQRGPRDSGRDHQHRPISNYYEYESVQAMISHAQENSNTSLPRRHHPPPPGPPPVAAAAASLARNGGNGSNIQNSLFLGNSQPHHMTMFKQTSGSFVHNQSARGNHTGVNMVQPVSHPLHREHTDIPRERPRDLPHLEGIYASGYRPASHYTGSHYKPPPPPPHHHTTKLTVPGSKV